MVDESPGLGLDTPPQPLSAAPYRVLARKYRPQSFAELIGQDAMVKTLGNAIVTVYSQDYFVFFIGPCKNMK